ncbi:TSUP family transporter [Herbaspirillum sp. LeCh32-8]|uniref:TSUP family transporter n=1 Tax=Herbaspirillum sp. LeCh32-8 TaxID=2821356 RepID=UPI001AE1B1A1|nr:TSUP family transporter [Herbaspirillum sp. LeCh32-8]MBP0596824.1 TSUP family transporter [Herbaspirillum sp. LeCh32-8]
MNYYLTLAAFGLLAGCAIPLLRTGSGAAVVPLVYCSLVALHPPGSAAHRLAMHIAVATSCCVLAVTAAAACRRQLRLCRLNWRNAWPMSGYAAAGALCGALSALSCSPFRLRLLYVLYLSALITDCALRFDRLARRSRAHAILAPALPRRWPAPLNALVLLAAGSLAAGAGVGGGAITVPLMQRQGHAPGQAAAMASMLAASAGAAASLMYLGAAWRQGQAAGLGSWYAGYIDLSAVAVLSAAGLLGMRLAAPFDGALSERLRVGAYMGLLLLVLFKMTT